MPARFAAPIGPLHSGRLGSAVLAEARRMPPETPDGSVEAGFAGCPPHVRLAGSDDQPRMFALRLTNS
jgi:hypothetical protein